MSKSLIEKSYRQIAQKNGTRSDAPDIPMSLLRQKACSAEASTIFKSHFHGAEVTRAKFFYVICRMKFIRRAFGTLVMIGNCGLFVLNGEMVCTVDLSVLFC